MSNIGVKKFKLTVQDVCKNTEPIVYTVQSVVGPSTENLHAALKKLRNGTANVPNPPFAFTTEEGGHVVKSINGIENEGQTNWKLFPTPKIDLRKQLANIDDVFPENGDHLMLAYTDLL